MPPVKSSRHLVESLRRAPGLTSSSRAPGFSGSIDRHHPPCFHAHSLVSPSSGLGACWGPTSSGAAIYPTVSCRAGSCDLAHGPGRPSQSPGLGGLMLIDRDVRDQLGRAAFGCDPCSSRSRSCCLFRVHLAVAQRLVDCAANPQSMQQHRWQAGKAQLARAAQRRASVSLASGIASRLEGELLADACVRKF